MILASSPLFFSFFPLQFWLSSFFPGRHQQHLNSFTCFQSSFTSFIQFISVAQSCPTLCDPMNRSMPGLPVHHQLPESNQTHVHRVGDAIHPTISSSIVPFSSCPQSFKSVRKVPRFCILCGLCDWGYFYCWLLMKILTLPLASWTPSHGKKKAKVGTLLPWGGICLHSFHFHQEAGVISHFLARSKILY